MKIKVLMIGLAGLISASSVFAQKGELSNAKEQYDKYFTTYRQKALAAVATTALNEAKASIDKASANDKTATLPLTYAVKGEIYSALAYRDTVPSTSTPLFATAEESLKKAKETDTKGENKKMIEDAYQTLIVIKYNTGLKAYNGGKFETAYENFNFYRTVKPDDTTALFLTGLAAANAKMYKEALDSYGKLIGMSYSKNPGIYTDMSFIYLAKKDTTSAIKIVTEGAAKYPNDASLSKREIELNLQIGKAKEMVSKIDAALAKDPNNKTLYYYAGLANSSAGDAAKAEAMYRKAVEIDPAYFDATLNLGWVLLSPALKLHNEANKLPASKQKEYDDDMKKAKALFEIAKPVLQKAVDIKPTYEALYNLRAYYLGVNDMTNANAIKKQMDAIK